MKQTRKQPVVEYMLDTTRQAYPKNSPKYKKAALELSKLSWDTLFLIALWQHNNKKYLGE